MFTIPFGENHTRAEIQCRYTYRTVNRRCCLRFSYNEQALRLNQVLASRGSIAAWPLAPCCQKSGIAAISPLAQVLFRVASGCRGRTPGAAGTGACGIGLWTRGKIPPTQVGGASFNWLRRGRLRREQTSSVEFIPREPDRASRRARGLKSTLPRCHAAWQTGLAVQPSHRRHPTQQAERWNKNAPWRQCRFPASRASFCQPSAGVATEPRRRLALALCAAAMAAVDASRDGRTAAVQERAGELTSLQELCPSERH